MAEKFKMGRGTIIRLESKTKQHGGAYWQPIRVTGQHSGKGIMALMVLRPCQQTDSNEITNPDIPSRLP